MRVRIQAGNFVLTKTTERERALRITAVTPTLILLKIIIVFVPLFFAAEEICHLIAAKNNGGVTANVMRHARRIQEEIECVRAECVAGLGRDPHDSDGHGRDGEGK